MSYVSVPLPFAHLHPAFHVFYAFGFQFCYMVFLDLFQEILVLSVILCWYMYNPPSIGHPPKSPLGAAQ